jgi:hypothetical protein
MTETTQTHGIQVTEGDELSIENLEVAISKIPINKVGALCFRHIEGAKIALRYINNDRDERETSKEEAKWSYTARGITPVITPGNKTSYEILIERLG